MHYKRLKTITLLGFFSWMTHLAPCSARQTFLLQMPEDAGTLSEAVRRIYLESFLPPKKVEITEEMRKKQLEKKIYEAERPSLHDREMAEILLTHVFTNNNTAFVAFFRENQKCLADFRPLMANNFKILKGSPSHPEQHLLNRLMPTDSSQIGKTYMALHLMQPIDDIERLEREQKTVRILAGNEEIYQKAQGIFKNIKAVETSLLSLLSASKDPLWFPIYKKMVFGVYPPNKNKKYTNTWKIEFMKRATFDFSILFTICLGFPFIIYWSYCKHHGIREMLKKSTSGKCRLTIELALNIFQTIFTLLILIRNVRMILRVHSTLQRYISGRIADVQIFIESAAALDQIIRSDAELEKLFGSKMAYTRKLMSLQHENTNYNKLMRILRTTNFKKWNMFLRCTGTLLTTMTLLEENIHMLDDMLFEVGRVEAYLAMATLARNPEGYENTFVYPSYEESPHMRLDLPRIWNPIIDAEKAVPNDVYIDGKKENAYCIIGPNACGKSIINQNIILAPYFAQTIYLVPSGKGASGVKITPISAFYVFKEPQDDPSRNKSLFAMEVEAASICLEILEWADSQGLKSIVSADEFFSTTNPLEGGAIQYAYTDEITKRYKNNLMVISTHNPDLINQFMTDERAQVVQVVIERLPSSDDPYLAHYKRTFKVKPGKSDEKVGIDLFYKEMIIAEELQEVAKEITKKAREKAQENKKKLEGK